MDKEKERKKKKRIKNDVLRFISNPTNKPYEQFLWLWNQNEMM